MNWSAIIPSLLVGSFVGWVAGAVMGHGETRMKMEQQERKLHALLKHLYWGQIARLNDMQDIMAILGRPDESEFIIAEMEKRHTAEIEQREDDKDGFFAEMFR